jgi:NAD-dependent dihydropyrimidine dehydrogenase PreA subunit
MTFVIADPCTDIKDRSCRQQCPVDCIYEGAHSLYINPEECIDCGACEPACPVEAVFDEVLLPDEYRSALPSNRLFFEVVIPGRDAPLGRPGSASNIGPVAFDTPYVEGLAAAKALDTR